MAPAVREATKEPSSPLQLVVRSSDHMLFYLAMHLAESPLPFWEEPTLKLGGGCNCEASCGASWQICRQSPVLVAACAESQYNLQRMRSTWAAGTFTGSWSLRLPGGTVSLPAFKDEERKESWNLGVTRMLIFSIPNQCLEDGNILFSA